MANSTQDLFDQGEDIQSSWMKFETVGDSIIGTLVDKFHKDGDGGFAGQEVYTLNNRIVNGIEQPAEDQWNVGIKETNNYINSRVGKLPVGSDIGFKYEKDIPPSQKGYQPAKSINVKRFAKPLHSNPVSSIKATDVDAAFGPDADIPFN